MMSNEFDQDQTDLEEDVLARGNFLIARPGAMLPARCVFCNSICQGPAVKISLSNTIAAKASSVGGLLLGPIGGLAGSLMDHAGGHRTQFGHLHVHICDVHRHVKRIVIRNVVIILVFSIVAGFVTSQSLKGSYGFETFGAPFLAVFLGIVGAIIYAMIMQWRAGFELVFENMESGFAVLRGAGSPFLKSLPQACEPDLDELEDL